MGCGVPRPREATEWSSATIRGPANIAQSPCFFAVSIHFYLRLLQFATIMVGTWTELDGRNRLPHANRGRQAARRKSLDDVPPSAGRAITPYRSPVNLRVKLVKRSDVEALGDAKAD